MKKRIRLTKIIDNFELVGEKYPRGINKGYIKEGYEINPPKIGERYEISNRSIESFFSTSPVIKITKGTIKTTYSTYKYEIIDEENKD